MGTGDYRGGAGAGQREQFEERHKQDVLVTAHCITLPVFLTAVNQIFSFQHIHPLGRLNISFFFSLFFNFA